MINKLCGTLLIIFVLQGFFIPVAQAEELKTRYATVRYDDPALLRKFNEELYLGRQLGAQLGQQRSVTILDEISNKLNVIVEKVETVLDMFPSRIYFTIVLLSSPREVQDIYAQKYNSRVNHVAYYSLSEKTIYLSVNNANIRVVAHEIGHMVVDHYFPVRPPYKIHELLAQFAETHVTD